MGDSPSVVVVGAGAIGGYVGGKLARTGIPVTLVARGDHLTAIQRKGIRVIEGAKSWSARVRATDDVRAVKDADAVFLGVKAYSLPELAQDLAHHLGPEAYVISAQNGIPWWYATIIRSKVGATYLQSVDPDGLITSALPVNRVLGCVVYCSTEIAEPGVIRHIEGTRFSLSDPTAGESSRCRAFSDALAHAGLKAPIDLDLAPQLWLKLIGNVAFNPISVLTGATLGEIGRRDDMVALVRAIMEEANAVAMKLDVRLPVSLDRRLKRGLEVGDHRTSMLQDFQAGKRLELDCLTGAVIELADGLGIDVPHTRAVHACVRLLEEVQAEHREQHDARVDHEAPER